MDQLIITVKGQVVSHRLQMIADEIPKVSRLVIYRYAQRIQTRMRTTGARPSYPIQWDSEKQRRAFFATKGFGKGIPYRRTGAYSAAWSVESLGADIGYRVKNLSAPAKHVGGDIFGKQSNIHKGRWTNFRKTVFEELKTLPEDIRKDITTTIYRHRGA